jgi:formylglycine-generating enzyme required for sulfatase activity/tetratricopeptide (TPR) repeat protein
MNALDVPILQGENFATVDLFEVEHAAKVLTRFGQAFGKLPANAGNLSADERQFVNDVSQGLAQDGKIVSVRLSLFAEMVKSKPWTAATLQKVGGTQGIGVNFLEETFGSRDANPRHRLHAVAARGVLRSLLPELDSNIKGGMRSHADLLTASGYQDRPSDFTDLLRILDGELCLITPTDPEGTPLGEPDASASGSLSSGSHTSHSGPSGSIANNPPAHAGGSPSSYSPRYYQLTHDYLVPSLREWLTRKQKETRKGRAELKLEERTALWTAKPENRYLPSLREWIGIRWLTEAKHWTTAQRSVMNRAARIHGLRTGLTVLGIGLIIAAALGLNRQADERRNQAEATRMVEGLLAANTAKVSDSLASLKPFRTWADAQLQQEFQQAAAESDAKLHAGLALLSEGDEVDPALLKYLQDRLLTVSAAQIGPVRELMEPQKSELIPAYWTVLKDTAQPAALRFRAACALAGFDADSSEWKNAELTALVADQLVAVSPEYIGEFKDLLRPVAPQLVPALSTIFKDPNRGELAKTLTTSLLADYAAKDPDTLTELVVAADAVSDKLLFPVLQQHQTTAVKNLEAVLAQRLEPDWRDAPLDPTWTEASPAIRAQIESAHGMITERFAFCQDMPLPQFLELAETLRESGYRPTRVRPHQSLLPLAGGEGGRRPDEGVADLAATSDLAVSAIWTRDSKRWHIDPSLKPIDLPAPEAPASKDGLLLADIAPLPLADETTEPEFIALWAEPANAEEQRRMLFDLTEAELRAANTAFPEKGFPSQSTISVRTDANGQRRYAAIWSNQGAPSEVRPAYAGFELVEQPQWDVAVAPAEKLADPLEPFRQQMAQIENLPAERLDEPEIRQIRAAAFYQLGNLEAALADFDFLISKEIVTANVLQYRTLTLARLGKADEAKQSMTQFFAMNPSPSIKWFVQIVVVAGLGEFEQASAELEAAATGERPVGDELYYYNVACAAALCSHALSGKDAAQSQKFADRTFELLRQVIAQGYTNANQLKSDADFASLHGDPRFVALLSQLEPPATWSGLWRADVEYESKLLAAVPGSNVAEQLKPFLAEGWRPFAIAVDSSGGARSAPSSALPGTFSPDLGGEGTEANSASSATGTVSSAPPSTVHSPPGKGEKVADRPDEGARGATERLGQSLYNGPLCSLVLHRPLIPDAAKESLALQQAAAATALLRLNATEKVWPLFQDQPDPRLRSYVLHRLATYGVDPQSLFTQLQQESETSRQRSLILGLGEFAKAKLLTPEQTISMTADLAKRYADDPDPGIHGAAEWTLRQLGAEADIAEVRAAYSTGNAVGDRRWYLTKTTTAGVAGLPTEPPSPTGGHPSSGVQRDPGRPAVERSAGSGDPRTTASVGMTFAILDASDEFLMGSPVSETDRYQGPTGRMELRHRRRIGRQFAIGTHEVTVVQFEAFRHDHQFDRTKAREEDSPANMITWYDAAAYCNWLSNQEGIPRDQWCYDPDQAFEEGMTLLPDYLQRTGYRLPSEAEWEYACRMGTTTARYFGETETLLGEYAWYTKTSGDKWMLPVGTLRPNGAGLFDMQGNVLEWCQDSAMLYGTDLAMMRDIEQTGKLSNSDSRVLRGGSFNTFAVNVRSATRHSDLPVYRVNDFGFRVARTYP